MWPGPVQKVFLQHLSIENGPRTFTLKLKEEPLLLSLAYLRWPMPLNWTHKVPNMQVLLAPSLLANQLECSWQAKSNWLLRGIPVPWLSVLVEVAWLLFALAVWDLRRYACSDWEIWIAQLVMHHYPFKVHEWQLPCTRVVCTIKLRMAFFELAC